MLGGEVDGGKRNNVVENDTVALDEPAGVRLPRSHRRAYTSSAIEAAARAAPPVSTGA